VNRGPGAAVLALLGRVGEDVVGGVIYTRPPVARAGRRREHGLETEKDSSTRRLDCKNIRGPGCRVYGLGCRV
jgi:hypothetical protein